MHKFSTAAAKSSGGLLRLRSAPQLAGASGIWQKTSGMWEAPQVPKGPQAEQARLKPAALTE